MSTHGVLLRDQDFEDARVRINQAAIDPDLLAEYSPGSKNYQSLWDDVVAAAEEANDPGRFSAIIGFEWTSLINGGNMHRVVLFRDGGELARKVVPMVTQAPFGSPDPRVLTLPDPRTQHPRLYLLGTAGDASTVFDAQPQLRTTTNGNRSGQGKVKDKA